ncbi:MAG: polyphosphate polymerase domain-containing protein [Clostridia bacterium]
MKATFKRYELKYFMTCEQKERLMQLINVYMDSDKYGKSCIYNIYYDTEEFLLIRRSIEKPVYKEKLRVRSYGKPKTDGKVFLELKKKYKSVVYKRRIEIEAEKLDNYFTNDYSLDNSQISREIDYFKSFYEDIAPRVFLSYDREAFFGKEDMDFRITFDQNIMWRESDLDFYSENYGNKIIGENMVLAEIKVAGAMPLWLTKFFSENHIYKTSFSKYGTAYKQILKNNLEVHHAS